MKKAIILIVLFSFYILKTNAQTPPDRTWYFNDYGQKTTVKEKWFEDENGFKHGTYIKYFKDGEREILGKYNHNKPNGQWEITIYNNILFKQVKSIAYANFNNGVEHGSYKIISGNIILIQGTYTNGVKTGYWKDDYNIDEKIYSEGNYIDGKKDGEWNNTNVILRSQELMDLIQLERFENNSYNKLKNVEEIKTETKKGYKSIFKNGEVIAVYDDKGINIIEKAKIDIEFNKCNTIEDKRNFINKYPDDERTPELKRKIIAWEKEEIDNKFNYAMDRYEDNGNYYGDTSYLISFLKKYPNTDTYYVNKIKEAITNKPDNDTYYKINNFWDYLYYQKIFPNGIHKDEVEKWVKEYFIKHKEDFWEFIVSDFKNSKYQECIITCKLFFKYQDDLHNTFYLPASICYSLSSWAIGDKTTAYELVKKYHAEIINYSDEDVKYLDRYFDMYKIHKKSLSIDNDKETYKKIHSLK